MPDSDHSTSAPPQNHIEHLAAKIAHPRSGRVLIFVGVFLVGLQFLIVAAFMPSTFLQGILIHIGQGLVAAVALTFALEVMFLKERARALTDAFAPLFHDSQNILGKINKLEGRFTAYKKLGLNYCYASRSEALAHFKIHAEAVLKEWDKDSTSSSSSSDGPGAQQRRTDSSNTPHSKRQGDSTDSRTRIGGKYINVVSSSAHGLIGYLNQEDDTTRESWRDLIASHPGRFRILLTHPAYAHFRQAAEERGNGQIELEILKAAMFFQMDAHMDGSQLRFYRGSPTAFLIEAGKHVLLNPYSYGMMAMHSLSLEFETLRSADSPDGPKESVSYIEDFVKMHFHHIWAFKGEPGKQVHGKNLVVAVSNFTDILKAFGECNFGHSSKRLRLTQGQVEELDRSGNEIAERVLARGGSIPVEFEKKKDGSDPTPFQSYARGKNKRENDPPDFTYCLADYRGSYNPVVDGGMTGSSTIKADKPPEAQPPAEDDVETTDRVDFATQNPGPDGAEAQTMKP